MRPQPEQISAVIQVARVTDVNPAAGAAPPPSLRAYSVADYDAADDALARLAAEVAGGRRRPCRFRRSRHADGASATACRPVVAPRRAHLCASARFGSSARTARAPDSHATSGRSAQRSRAGASTGFGTVSLRASPSHLSGLGPPRRPLLWSHALLRQRPSPFGKGPDLRKLVAGAGFEPVTSGLSDIRRASPRLRRPGTSR